MLGYGNFRGSGSSSGGFGGSRGGFRGGGGGFRPRRPFNDGPREMTKIKCAECGKEDEVPFKPRDGTSVLCKECYFKKKGITPRSSAPAKEAGSEENEDVEFGDSPEESEKPKKKKEKDEFEESEESEETEEAA